MKASSDMKYFLFRWGYGSQAHMGGSPLIGQPNSLGQPVGWAVGRGVLMLDVGREHTIEGERAGTVRQRRDVERMTVTPSARREPAMAVSKVRFDSPEEAQQWLDDERQGLIDDAVSDISDPDVKKRAASVVGDEFDRWADRNSPSGH
jgi:hypothetical protein